MAFCWETPQIPAEVFSLFAWHGDSFPNCDETSWHVSGSSMSFGPSGGSMKPQGEGAHVGWMVWILGVLGLLNDKWMES